MINRIKNKIYRTFKLSTKEILGNNNRINIKGKFINSRIQLLGNNNSITISSGAVLYNTTILMYGDYHTLFLGEEVVIKEAIFRFEDHHGSILVDKKVTVESALFACIEPYKRILIGEDCMISDNVEMRTGDSHTIFNTIDNQNERRVINEAKDIILGKHVWVGAKTTILKGVSIGANSIIGLGTIVTKDVPNNCIFAGVPGKIIRKDINWSRTRFYNESTINIEEHS